jgi:V/A-type H+-transporting ATPase subunit I
MIVSMKHLDLVCLASCREATLRRLRALGVVHLDLVSSSGTAVIDAKAKLSDAERAVRIIRKARTEEVGDVRARSVEEVLAIDADRETLKTERDRLEREIGLYEPFGDFDPVLAKELLSKVEGLTDVVTLPEKLPSMRLSRLREKYERVVNRINIDTAKLAICDDMAILSSFPSLADSMAFEQAKELLQDHGAVCVISGWVPVTKLSKLMEEVRSSKGDLFDRANSLGWGVLVRDPAEGETPPTLVEPPKLFRPVKALFEGLGIAPGYTEADVSVPFMCYFSLFFAMLVGDGAYGAIFLAATLWGWKKYRASKGNALMKSWLVMLTVFSASTVIWGLLSNTWFGAQIPYFKSWPTVKWLADPSYNNMMLLCFTIGVSHLMLARIWNGICKINDTTAIAEFGWAGILLFMYFVTNSIVGIFSSIPQVMFYVFGFSLIAVFAFTVKPSELKSRGAELGMLPLNIMSALGDIISYVRLFAVGLASVKVAENFNSMAIGLVSGADEWWLKAIFSILMVLILILGHALNLVMAGLSILVHAVRLNTLEFSNHKGISWAGYAFKPFRKTKEK